MLYMILFWKRHKTCKQFLLEFYVLNVGYIWVLFGVNTVYGAIV